MSAARINSLVGWMIERLATDEKLVAIAIERLQANLENPIHYGDNKPGWTFGRSNLLLQPSPNDPPDGGQIVPDARFNYYDLFSFGISGEDGYKGFLRDCALPSSTPYVVVVVATALLLVDEAVAALDGEDSWYATWTLYQAHDLLADLYQLDGDKDQQRKERAAFASAGGKARHRETDEYKAEVLEAWAAKEEKGVGSLFR